jgi:hypothetical protein
MRDHAAEAVENVRGRSRCDLDNDRIFALAMIDAPAKSICR